MKILFVSPEVAPLAKTGGLADVAGALPQALHQLGHEVRIVMPRYRCIGSDAFTPTADDPRVEAIIDGRRRRGRVRHGKLGEVPVYFIENRRFFDRPELYGPGGGDYPDNALRFGFFCRAVVDLLRRSDFRPDVVHLNDWQTGLIPVLLRNEHRDDPRLGDIGTVLTIHNLGYQGLFPADTLPALGLDPALFTMEGLEYYGQLSFLKAGIVYSDLLTTVSETYCREIQTPEMGFGFDGILRSRRDDLFGIVNGLDTAMWDPARDRALETTFDADHLEEKAADKKALQQELGLPAAADTPVVAMVTRLDVQKGLDIVEAAWEKMMRRDLQFVLLGSGDRQLMNRWRRIQRAHPRRAAIRLSFDDGLARRIYGGSDIFLMPSRYEPCGLGQLIALRYGCLPLVRRTGGLADTVTDPEHDPPRANGFTFEQPAAPALLEGLDRALDLHADRPRWNAMVRRAMAGDFSWTGSARRYIALYRKALEKRGV